jgi:hypothetical protein
MPNKVDPDKSMKLDQANDEDKEIEKRVVKEVGEPFGNSLFIPYREVFSELGQSLSDMGHGDLWKVLEDDAYLYNICNTVEAAMDNDLKSEGDDDG